MESEFSGHLLEAVGRLAAEIGSLKAEVENLKCRQEALEGMMQRVMAELRQEQAELRREWQDFGTRLNVYSVAWEARLQSQLQQLEAFARQLRGFTERFTALLPSEEE